MQSPTKTLHQKINILIRWLQKYTNRWWYAPLIALLALIDHFVIIIPTDGLLVSSVMLNPKRWIANSLIVTLGSSIGALMLAALIQFYGMDFLLMILPSIQQSTIWSWTEHFMDDYGLIVVFCIALSPIMQHPAIALAALAGSSLQSIFVVVFLGRIIKYTALDR
ncbi:MAG: VTT domain-containing protein, partial [Pseudobdellovibrionaceae bacterium]